jgi:hypothetical protein
MCMFARVCILMLKYSVVILFICTFLQKKYIIPQKYTCQDRQLLRIYYDNSFLKARITKQLKLLKIY